METKFLTSSGKLLISELVIHRLRGYVHRLGYLVEVEMQLVDLLAAWSEAKFESFAEPVLVINYPGQNRIETDYLVCQLLH